MIKEEKDVVIMRMTKVLRERLLKLAEKRKTTLTSLTKEAVERFLDQEEYIFEDVLEVIENIPSLRVHKELIIKEMKKCPPRICKEMVETLKDKEAFVFEEKFKTINDKIKTLEKLNLYGIFLNISTKENHTNEINEILKKISDLFKDIRLSAGIKESSKEDKILLFISYNKKGSDKNEVST